MTSFAFILGVVPLVFATGAGAWAGGRWEPPSWAACCFPRVLNLFFIPMLYVIVSSLLKAMGAKQPEVAAAESH